MRIEVISMWYNEALIAPFFLDHYKWADKITVFLDTDTDDSSAEICSRFKNVSVVPFAFPDMLDDGLKARHLSDAAATSKADWVINADADEFVFKLGGDIRDFLAKQKNDVFRVAFWQIYRHRTESDLDYTKPALEQRRHGDPRAGFFARKKYIFIKPIVVRPKIMPLWTPGNHRLLTGRNCLRHRSDYLEGVHWAMADPEMAVIRRMHGPIRQSKVNKKKGWTSHQWQLTKESILAECAAHFDDPKLF